MLGQSDFLGEWRLERVIVDQLNGQNGTLTGRATFTGTDPNAVIYEENGTLILESGASMAASRQYLWEFGAPDVTVRFSDGSSFHQFTPTGYAAGTDHPCGADFYTVRYDFTSWPQWRAVWTVTGPRKDYVSTSVYAR